MATTQNLNFTIDQYIQFGLLVMTVLGVSAAFWSNHIARRSYRIQNRAYLGLDNICMSDNFDRCEFDLRNYGPSAAYEVVLFLRWTRDCHSEEWQSQSFGISEPNSKQPGYFRVTAGLLSDETSEARRPMLETQIWFRDFAGFGHWKASTFYITKLYDGKRRMHVLAGSAYAVTLKSMPNDFARRLNDKKTALN